jgi:hypothetical protein
MAAVDEAILRKIIRNHGVEIVTHGGDLYASLGGRLTVEITDAEADRLNDLDEEEN